MRRLRSSCFRLARVAGAAVALLAPFPALAQGCALCYTQAAAASARLVQGLRNGILILIIPPMFMSVGITLLAYRKRNSFREEDDETRDLAQSGDAANQGSAE